MITLAIANHKGGVGKTTTAVNLAGGLAQAGKKVLLVDLDPQQNLSMHLGMYSTEMKGIEYFLSGELPAEEVIQQYSDNLHVLPAGKKLAVLKTKLHQFPPTDERRYFTVKRAFEKAEWNYDYMIFDCPPSLGLLTINALSFVQFVFIPIQCQFFALQGTVKIRDLIQTVQNKYNPDLKIGKVIPVMFDTRNKISKVVLKKIKDHFGEDMSENKIRVNTKLAEASAFQKTIFDYNKNCYGSWDYKRLAQEVLSDPKLQ